MNYKQHFDQLIEQYGISEASGFIETYIPGVRFFWSLEHVARAPMPHHCGIVIMGHGHKIGYLNGRTFRYDANNYLISSVPTAYECETCGSEDNPVMGLGIGIDLSRLRQIITKIKTHLPDKTFIEDRIFSGIEPVRVSSEMQAATEKLLLCLKSPLDSDVLGQALVDEIIYRAMLGDHGHALYALTQNETHYARIANVLTYINEQYMQPIVVEALADRVNMSVSSFHRAFKAVTSDSPMQYLKKLRLHQARLLMMRDQLRVATAANRVGYTSVSQFSREFKRHFNVPPSDAQHAAYASLYQ